jgi:hypothetical protein
MAANCVCAGIADHVTECLAALEDVREILWPDGNPDAEWSPDTIEQIEHRLAFLRPTAKEQG